MFSSPAKRQKTTSAAPLAIDTTKTQDATTEHQNNRSPRRASYQSPTKASLARFNPELLNESDTRSREKENTRPSEDAQTVAHANGEQKLRDLNQKRTHGLGEPGKNVDLDVQWLDEPEPATESQSVVVSSARRRPTSPNTRMGTHELPHMAEREQAQALNKPSTSMEQHTQAEKLQRRRTSPDKEPELPPTRVQLGLEKKAPPPSGILSSSSPSSRSPSRKKRRLREGVKSSPLKSRDKRSTGEADIEAAPLLSLRPKDPDLSPEIVQKQKLKNELTTQLEQLRQEVAKLEAQVRLEDVDDEVANVDDTEKELIALLTTSNPSCDPPAATLSPPPTIEEMIAAFLPFAPSPGEAEQPSPSTRTAEDDSDFDLKLDKVSDLSYLTLFTPLQLFSMTMTKRDTEPDRILQIHHVNLVPPSQFKPHHLSVTFQIITDPLALTVESVTLSELLPSNEHGDLRQWISRRLASPIVGRDMGGLGWGVGRYWKAMVERAEIWKSIIKAVPEYVEARLMSSWDGDGDLRPYISRSSLTLRAAGLKWTTKKALLITYRLPMTDWTAEVGRDIDICAEGVGKVVEAKVKTVFVGLVRKGGIVWAAKGIADMVLGS